MKISDKELLELLIKTNRYDTYLLKLSDYADDVLTGYSPRSYPANDNVDFLTYQELWEKLFKLHGALEDLRLGNTMEDL